MTRVAAIVPAGGGGKRLGGVAKAFLPLAGRPLLQHVTDALLAHPSISMVIIALPASAIADPPEWLTRDRVRLVQGGAERMDSVRACLDVVPASIQIVLIHDAARPILRRALIDRVIDVASSGEGAVAALPATDTLHQASPNGYIVATPDRDSLWRAQTPQGFPLAMIREAHARAAREGRVFTDDGALAVHYGARVRLVEGDPANLKITVPGDIAVAERLLTERR